MPFCAKCGSTGVHSQGASCEFKHNRYGQVICRDGEACKRRVKAQQKSRREGVAVLQSAVNRAEGSRTVGAAEQSGRHSPRQMVMLFGGN